MTRLMKRLRRRGRRSGALLSTTVWEGARWWRWCAGIARRARLGLCCVASSSALRSSWWPNGKLCELPGGERHTFTSIEGRKGEGTTGGVVARRGRPDLSPQCASALTLPSCCPVPGRRGGAGLSWRGGVGVGAVELGRAGGEGAPPDAA